MVLLCGGRTICNHTNERGQFAFFGSNDYDDSIGSKVLDPGGMVIWQPWSCSHPGSRFDYVNRSCSMSQAKVHIVLRQDAAEIGILDIQGEITGFAEEALMAAYQAASSGGATTIALNLTGLESINSFGIGLLIKLLASVQRHKQRLVGYGLAEDLRQAFELTHLDEAIALCADEAEMLRSARR
jgi:anti-anti-sigma factor